MRVLAAWLSAAVWCIVAVRVWAEVPVRVSLRHDWHNYTSAAAHAAPLLEMIEAAGHVWPKTYFEIVGTLWQDETSSADLASLSPEALYAHVERTLHSHALDAHDSFVESHMEEWRMRVAQHAEAARIEAAYQAYTASGISAPCDTFALVHGQALCTPEALRDHAHGASSESARLGDHVYPAALSPGPVAILYADPYSPAVHSMHAALMDLAAASRVRYVLRWRPSVAHVEARPMQRYLSGFGTRMHLKKVDYLVLDDRSLDKSQHTELNMSHERDRVGEYSETLSERLHAVAGKPRRTLQEAVKEHNDLPVEKYVYLGQAAAHAALTSDDPLSTLESIALDFPAHSAALYDYYAALPEDDIITTLDDPSWHVMDAGTTQLWMNGLRVPSSSLHPISLMQMVHEELDLMEALGAPEIGVSPRGVETIMSNPLTSAAFYPSERPPVFYDASDKQERDMELGGEAITWINDLTSSMYSDWPRTLVDMSRYRWMSGFPLIQQNFFQLVVLLDMRDVRAVKLVGLYMEAMLADYPIRWGIVPLLGDPEHRELAQILWLANEQLTPFEVSLFLTNLAASSSDEVEPSTARRVLREMLPSSAMEDDDLRNFLEGGASEIAGYARPLEVAQHYLERLHTLKRPGSAGVAYLNGEELSLDEHLTSQLLGAIMRQLKFAWNDIRSGYIDTNDRYTRYFFDLDATVKRRSALVTMAEDARSFIRPNVFVRLPDVTRALGDKAYVIRDFLYARDELGVSVRIVGDLNARATIDVMRMALQAMKAAPFRLSFVHTGQDDGDISAFLLDAMHAGALSDMPFNDLYDALSSDDVHADLHVLRQAYEIRPSHGSWTPIQRAFASALGTHVNGPMILLNGQAFSDLQGLARFDIESVVAWEEKMHVLPLLNVLDVPGNEHDMRAQVLEFAISVLGSAASQRPGSQNPFEAAQQQRESMHDLLTNPALEWHMGHENAPIAVTAVLDPVSASAPQLVSLLRMLTTLESVRVTVMMNPRIRVPSLPLSEFARYDFRTAPHFQDGAEVMPSVSFEHLPQQAVLTMQMQAPRSLVAMAAEAVYDLDNLRLADVHGSVDTVYAVNSVLIEGHARDEHGPVPEGLQLDLVTEDARVLDTIVMENLGYFQFRAQPGRWSLQIHDGRSSELYEMTSVGAEGWISPGVNVTGTSISLDTLAGRTIFPVFGKRRGKEAEELIASADPDTYASKLPMPSLVRAALGRARRALQRLHKRKSRHADINIFTLASGHLYERMTYIMVLSVLRHTKSSVKFWFVENFLSPSFKAFIPHLAEAYGFEYELITYAWPEWLRAQTEKQRMIWAYKILFLDVLFPLDLDRVIFVDADQIVRADLQELVDMDLHGAPYAYPPMGDDSEDMDGYRFWKQGYWKTMLAGRPYHISALYVVDLKRFRYVNAGNILRRHYQTLTADKNSLANLDQDLPNNLQYLLPIHTLDKTWLWCETWCSHAWLPSAKTIDLCSNPKTKEPKLDRARRQIPEWTELDNEVAALAERLRTAPRKEAVHDEL